MYLCGFCFLYLSCPLRFPFPVLSHNRWFAEAAHDRQARFVTQKCTKGWDPWPWKYSGIVRQLWPAWNLDPSEMIRNHSIKTSELLEVVSWLSHTCRTFFKSRSSYNTWRMTSRPSKRTQVYVLTQVFLAVVLSFIRKCSSASSWNKLLNLERRRSRSGLKIQRNVYYTGKDWNDIPYVSQEMFHRCATGNPDLH